MKYRADIDGLRAIAILLVLIYHGGLTYFPSGFIGVDIFFVISGFLITHIIHDSLNKQNFSFIDFYNRRLWRLQPAFLCFIFAITAITLFYFLPDDLIQYSKSARKTSLFISNLFFNKTTTGYFSPDSHQLPLLHTWSLSIEWQCYLILPVVMYGLHRVFHKHLLAIVYLSTLICLMLSMHYSQQLPAQSYYQFSSRMFEFLIGSCIALTPWPQLSIHKFIVNSLSMLALMGIFYIASLEHILLGYPNWYALGACMATGVLIAIGSAYPTQFGVRLLSCKPLVFIGWLSYSLYLWHWGVFAILRYQSIVETPMVLCSAYLLTFILAYLSWRYIEKPARRFNTLKFRYTLVSLLLLPILLIHLSSHVISIHEGYPQRFNEELVAVYQQLDHYASAQRPLCIGNEAKADASCTMGSKKSNAKTGLLIGDSFSNHYWGFVDVLGKDANVAILAQGTSSCITLPGLYLYDWWHFKNQVYQECYDQTQKYYQMIQQHHYDYVMIGQIWNNYIADHVINKLGDERSLPLAKQRLTVALDKALTLITASGAKPVLIKTTALMRTNFHDCFFKHIKLRKPYAPEQCNFDLVSSDADQWLGELFEQMKVKYPQLIIIDPKQVQCPNHRCQADVNGVPVYRDVGHITDYASYQFGKYYLKKFSNPFKEKS